jgi:phosphoadenosine phosphosulfate reductase|tara:strand:+ start:3298 stop:4014 length:717 start_codon:yes stop_codon:yes gene_type:complete
MESSTLKLVQTLNAACKDLGPKEVLLLVNSQFRNRAVLTSSLGKEDQYITHIIAKNSLDIKIVTLDTGRLFSESYDLLAKTQLHYKLQIQTFFPNTNSVETYVDQEGINGFYNSVESRKRCCSIRKIESLQRAIAGYEVWVTGIRAEQNDNRQNMPQWEWDEVNQILKVHPLLHLKALELENEISENDIPINSLHDQGYLSIGCAPCTKSVEPGEHERSGRWWWEQDKKECGLHLTRT